MNIFIRFFMVFGLLFSFNVLPMQGLADRGGSFAQEKKVFKKMVGDVKKCYKAFDSHLRNEELELLEEELGVLGDRIENLYHLLKSQLLQYPDAEEKIDFIFADIFFKLNIIRDKAKVLSYPSFVAKQKENSINLINISNLQIKNTLSRLFDIFSGKKTSASFPLKNNTIFDEVTKEPLKNISTIFMAFFSQSKSSTSRNSHPAWVKLNDLLSNKYKTIEDCLDSLENSFCDESQINEFIQTLDLFGDFCLQANSFYEYYRELSTEQLQYYIKIFSNIVKFKQHFPFIANNVLGLIENTIRNKGKGSRFITAIIGKNACDAFERYPVVDILNKITELLKKYQLTNEIGRVSWLIQNYQSYPKMIAFFEGISKYKEEMPRLGNYLKEIAFSLKSEEMIDGGLKESLSILASKWNSSNSDSESDYLSFSDSESNYLSFEDEIVEDDCLLISENEQDEDDWILMSGDDNLESGWEEIPSE